VQRSTIGLIWIGGLVLAALFYVIGPDRFLDQCIVALDALNEAIHTLVISLGAQAYDVVHALALALLVVFVALGLLAARRGLGGGWMMIVIPVLFLFLVWRPFAYGPTPIGRWLVALVLALFGAVSMTRRLTGPMPPPSGPWAAPRWPADRP
jgi:hypothetical protein